MPGFEDDKNYVNEKLPFYVLQRYAYHRAMMKGSLDIAFFFAATSATTATATYYTPFPFNAVTAMFAFVSAMAAGGALHHRQDIIKPNVELSSVGIRQEDIDRVEILLQDRRFRETLVNPLFYEKFYEGNSGLYPNVAGL